MKALLLALPLIATTAAAAGAGDAEQLRCLGIGDSAARLACYDAAAIALRDAKPKDTMPAVTGAAAVATQQQEFGRLPKARSAEAEQLESHIPGPFSGWSKGSSLRLANGQVWQVVDEGSGVRTLTDPKVTIRPGFLGSYFMTIEGVGFQVKVKRVQ